MKTETRIPYLPTINMPEPKSLRKEISKSKISNRENIKIKNITKRKYHIEKYQGEKISCLKISRRENIMLKNIKERKYHVGKYQ